jgi:hypothetical protein
MVSIYFCYNGIMERDILGQVIEAEKEIQQCLELEKVKEGERIERVKKECEEEFIREKRDIEASLEKSKAEATREAEGKAAGTVRRAAAEAERLGRLQKETLSRIIARQITGILPG